MELFALNDEVETLKDAFQSARNAPTLEVLVPLAWHFRQRDSRFAMSIADQAETLINEQHMPAVQADCFRARLHLIRGEERWLQGDFDQAEVLAENALSLYSAHGDQMGIGDSLWLLSFIANAQEKTDAFDQLLIQANSAYASTGDEVRTALVTLRRIFNKIFFDVPAAQIWLDEFRTGLDEPPGPAIATWLESADALILNQTGHMAKSIVAFVRSYEAALVSGQIRIAALAAINISSNFEDINDVNTALKWQEISLKLARENNWRMLVATCLCYTGKSMIELDRCDAAIAMLNESLESLPPGSHAQAVAWTHLGDATLALKDWHAAIGWYEKAEGLFRLLENHPPLIRTQKGRAKALLQLGERFQARDLCRVALADAQVRGLHQEECLILCSLAETCSPEGTLHQATGNDCPSPLDCLEAAYKVAHSIDGFITPVHLLESLAAEHARLGDGAKAYALALEAGKSRERISIQEANNRATALQIDRETEQLKRDAEQQKLLHESEALRANDLAKANATLERLGEIGRDITASQGALEVFAALERHVMALLDAYSLVVLRLSPDESHLASVFAIEDGRPLTDIRIPMNDTESLNARCARERREIVLELDASEGTVVQGTAATQSMMFAPLIAGHRLLGVMTIQSLQRSAYAERERAIFRSLCAYGAIALANADAQAQLLAQNKELDLLATTDRLTGLFNRRYLDQILDREYASANRSSQGFSLIILDIDYFKKVNDTYGHHAGDEVLSTIGKLLQSRVRDSDIAGRWGGEEFLVICPASNLADTLVLAESLRELVEQTEFPVVGRKTASFGVACYRHGDSIATLSDRADKSLYLAKDSGRNRVCSIQ